jgi:hypothetical protein
MEREGREHKPLVYQIEGNYEETRTYGPTRAPGKGRNRARRTILVVGVPRSTPPAAGGTLVGAGCGAAGGAIYDMTRCER